MLWLHNGAMPNIQVKDVPAEVHAVLRDRAAASHQSLQEYLLQLLAELTARPTMAEVLARVGARPGGVPPTRWWLL